MIRIAAGPVSAAPSWAWIGRDMLAALPGDYATTFFDDFAAAPDADIVCIVKQRPPERFVAAARANGAKVVFAPVDVYSDISEIAADAAMLSRCDLVLLHSEALRPHLARFARRLALVDHHLRYLLTPPAEFHTAGYVLWVGSFGNLPCLLHWVARRDLPYELRVLTNATGHARRILAHYFAHGLGVRLQFGQNSVNGLPMFAWSERRQEEMMRACRAAIDIKSGDFRQATKPPTKAQKFIASGIPFACNADSPVAAYFARRGFRVAEPADADRLFSRDYWRETQAEAARLRQELSFENVAASYHRIFEAMLDGRASLRMSSAPGPKMFSQSTS